MRAIVTVKEWHCGCGYMADALQAIVTHMETCHEDVTLWSLTLDVGLKEIGATEGPYDRLVESRSLWHVHGTADVRVYAGTEPNEDRLRQRSELGIASERWPSEGVSLRYPSYDAEVTLGCPGLVSECYPPPRLPGHDAELNFALGVVRKLRTTFSLVAGDGKGQTVQSYSTPRSVLSKILKGLPRTVRQQQRGGRKRGRRSTKTQELYRRIREAYDSSDASVTNRDLARKFGVSVATVQRALRETIR